MSAAPPSYSAISLSDPPDYSTAVGNRSISPPPPYVDPPGSFGTSLTPETELPIAPVEVQHVKYCIENWCVPIWILFLISLALLHLVLLVIYFKCPLPKTSLGAIRTLFFLHSIFLAGIIIYCYCKYKRRSALTACDGLLATLIYFHLPLWTGVFGLFPVIINDINGLNEAIQSSLTVTNAYPCSVSFYKLVFGVVISHYIAIPVALTVIIIYACVYLSPCCKLCFCSINTQGGPRNTQVQPEI